LIFDTSLGPDSARCSEAVAISNAESAGTVADDVGITDEATASTNGTQARSSVAWGGSQLVLEEVCGYVLGVSLDASDGFGPEGVEEVEPDEVQAWLVQYDALQDQAYTRALAVDFFISLLNTVEAWTDRTLHEVHQWEHLTIEERNQRGLEIFGDLPVETPQEPLDETPIPPATQHRPR
jgi:hypothetical protein